MFSISLSLLTSVISSDLNKPEQGSTNGKSETQLGSSILYLIGNVQEVDIWMPSMAQNNISSEMYDDLFFSIIWGIYLPKKISPISI